MIPSLDVNYDCDQFHLSEVVTSQFQLEINLSATLRTDYFCSSNFHHPMEHFDATSGGAPRFSTNSNGVYNPHNS